VSRNACQFDQELDGFVIVQVMQEQRASDNVIGWELFAEDVATEEAEGTGVGGRSASGRKLHGSRADIAAFDEQRMPAPIGLALKPYREVAGAARHV